MRKIKFKKNELLTIIGIVVAIAGLYFNNSGITYAPQTTENSSGAIQVQGDNNNINTPTIFEVVKTEYDTLPDGRYQIIVYTKHVGEQIIPEFKVNVQVEGGYLNCGEAFSCISIDQLTTVNLGLTRSGAIFYNLSPKDYTIRILFIKKPSTEPKVFIYPQK